MTALCRAAGLEPTDANRRQVELVLAATYGGARTDVLYDH